MPTTVNLLTVPNIAVHLFYAYPPPALTILLPESSRHSNVPHILAPRPTKLPRMDRSNPPQKRKNANQTHFTLHLVSARDFDCYRLASRSPNHVYSQQVRQLQERGVDVEAIRAEIIAAVRERPLSRTEIRSVGRHLVPEDLPEWAVWSTVALSGDVINLAEDARFGYFGGGRYRLAPPVQSDSSDAFRHVAAAYFAAFCPATRADLAQWSGQPVSLFAEPLDSLDLVTFRAEDGRTLLDLPHAPRPDADVPAPRPLSSQVGQHPPRLAPPRHRPPRAPLGVLMRIFSSYSHQTLSLHR